MGVKMQGRWFKYKESGVYEREDGVRIHPHGLIRSAEGITTRLPWDEFQKCIKIVGGRSARAAMYLAGKISPLTSIEHPE